ncbi:related to UDP-N-ACETYLGLUCOSAMINE--PEPTIDE N-ACETYLGLUCOSAMINYLTRANSFERASE [Lecanosticta acicola]|uniref:protein O-GlcNAc transferase n=1 Tax=Lecanosticta acicola TaxID=111012 RepID=A0AAI9EAQ8_9PEZI|nr:related to UDP-N-ACETYLGLUCOSAMINE--PEPTIDE N-ACETYLGLUCOSAMINYLTRANSFERASE [Lecanosticta acicola]
MSADVSPSNYIPPHADAFSHPGLAGPVDGMPYLTQRYALPIHQPGFRGDSHDATSSGGERTPLAENTLRRKTPNGTLNAGYDASADHLTPPLKHQLLPLGEDHSSRLVSGSAQSGQRTFLQHQHQQQQRQNAGFGGWSTPNALGWQGGQFTPSPSAFPVMDSMLSQGLPPQHMNIQQYYGQTVPSVIQPSFQYLGPTASGGQGSGPYGPYWHDGTFVPYRPAAVRDPRFYQHTVGHFAGSLPSSQLAYQANLWQQQNSGQSPWTPAQGVPPYTPPALNFPSAPHHGHVGAGFASGNHMLPSGGHFSAAHQSPMSSLPYAPNDQYRPCNVDDEYGPTSPNGRQRDKTFQWALQQYRDLIGYIHHTRSHHQQSRQANGQHHVSHRPSFYPKPPRQSASGSSLQLSKAKADSDALTTNSDEDPPISPSNTVKAVNVDRSSNTPKPHPISVWSPSGVHFHDNEYHRRASHDQSHGPTQLPAHLLLHQPDKSRTLRRSTGSSISSIVSPVPHDDSPPSRASQALQHITRLCQGTDWQWTDGMHLGGCLAYGLGNYQKALRWYTKVLERDPKHLEATSNMAATLLALGQRLEAEQHWMQVIKVAPNHFEAVEHLVGLLCNEQRSKEAIKVIEYVERSLRQPKSSDTLRASDRQSECSSSTASRSPCISEKSDKILYDFDADGEGLSNEWRDTSGVAEPGFGSSGFAVPGADNGRILALIHAKGNMLYGLGDNAGAARAFEDAVLIATGRSFESIQGLVKHILTVVTSTVQLRAQHQGKTMPSSSSAPILLSPEQALATAKLCFPFGGELPGLRFVSGGVQNLARKAVMSTTSNSLLSLAKIFQDGMSNAHRCAGVTPLAHGVRDILALYYLSLSLQPSPSTANNVGILLASVQQAARPTSSHQKIDIPGVAPGSGIALALQYYNYGLQLDSHHAHLYTNLGSLLKDIGQLDAAINMYERAVKCDGKFDIALANLANAVKDKGRISDAIGYYKRAVEASPEFAEAVCGLANALNSVCAWQARGGIAEDGGRRDRWHVDANGMLLDARQPGATSSGWIKRVVEIVEKQLVEGENWGRGSLTTNVLEEILQQVTILDGQEEDAKDRAQSLKKTTTEWMGQKWEGARVTRLIERATRRIGWHWYRDTYVSGKQRTPSSYNRPQLPLALTVPTAPTVLPFHTFTCPMSAKQIRLISQRNGLRISVSTLRSPWLPKQVYPPPGPPTPCLRVGYVSSDFNNHPLAHLMQSVFGLHDRSRVEAYCYATTAGDNSVHRQQIQREAPVFHDASSWSMEKLVKQIVLDGIHILVNLNGYTRGARNEVFAARPAPIQMSFMGFAGTLGAEWCDYLLADETAIPVDTLRPWRRNVDVEDQLVDENSGSENNDWVYGENIIYCRDTFFCCDHKQSAPDALEKRISWEEEQKRRWKMRKDLFPQISDDTIIFGNFNQLYKIEPTTFRTWLRILARVPNSILWLLRFPDLGESHLLATARMWAGAEVASRVVFTDVAPKHLHISRARICDLVVDTAECNAHTTAADVLWSGTPLLTLPRYAYKMCSRMAASILKGALPKDDEGKRAAEELVAEDEEDYEEKAVALGRSFSYIAGSDGVGRGRLGELRKMLFHARWSSALFDTNRWVRDLEDAYDESWKRWVSGDGGDIWLDRVPRREDKGA